MKTTIYAYYGMLAHEKTPVYSPDKVEGHIREELTVEIPCPALAWVGTDGKRHIIKLEEVK